nr:hypothetical protein CJLB15_00078 [Campylobacter phage CJLB-15]
MLDPAGKFVQVSIYIENIGFGNIRRIYFTLSCSIICVIAWHQNNPGHQIIVYSYNLLECSSS